jgi:hypothetical protein
MPINLIEIHRPALFEGRQSGARNQMSHTRYPYPHDGATLSSSPSPISIEAFGGFVVCPAPLAFFAMGVWTQSIYRMAYEQARATLQTSTYDRLITPCLN